MMVAAAPRPGAADLFDNLMPRYDVRNHHEIDVAASLADTWDALQHDDILAGSLVSRVLFLLRGLGTRRGALSEGMKRTGFSVLAERPGREIVLGIAGRFWALRERRALRRLPDAESFKRFDEPGWAKAAMTIRLEPIGDAATRVVTETRVRCCDATARLLFRVYWAIVGPFSGLIRRELLQGLRAAAERRRFP
jgi:hypothetical protein